MDPRNSHCCFGSELESRQSLRLPIGMPTLGPRASALTLGGLGTHDARFGREILGEEGREKDDDNAKRLRPSPATSIIRPNRQISGIPTKWPAETPRSPRGENVSAAELRESAQWWGKDEMLISGIVVADGVFYAELNEFFTRELAQEGYSGVQVRVTPTVTDISKYASRQFARGQSLIAVE